MTTDTVTLDDFKRGDTYSYEYTYTDADGERVDLTGTTITAHIKTLGGVAVAEMVGTLRNQAVTATKGQFDLAPVIADTSAWPLGVHVMDVRFDNGGAVWHNNGVILQATIDPITGETFE